MPAGQALFGKELLTGYQTWLEECSRSRASSADTTKQFVGCAELAKRIIKW
jgi:hypothetical protein